MVGALGRGQSFLEDVVHSFLFRPLQVPPGSVDLSPPPTLQGLEDAVAEGGSEGDLGAG